MKSVFAGILLSVVLFSCSTNDSVKNSGPKESLLSFLDAMNKNDYKKARTLCSAESQSLIDSLEKGTMNNGGMSVNFTKFDTSKFMMMEPKITGDSCLVPATVRGEDLPLPVQFPMRKESGSWKVHLTERAMMQANEALVDSMMNRLKNAFKNMGDSVGGFGKDFQNGMQKIGDSLEAEFNKLKQ